MHGERSGFENCSFGSNPHGIHLAAGPDMMHLVLEGLAKTLIDCIAAVLQESGILQ